jgi:hypothetical protein
MPSIYLLLVIILVSCSQQFKSQIVLTPTSSQVGSSSLKNGKFMNSNCLESSLTFPAIIKQKEKNILWSHFYKKDKTHYMEHYLFKGMNSDLELLVEHSGCQVREYVYRFSLTSSKHQFKSDLNDVIKELSYIKTNKPLDTINALKMMNKKKCVVDKNFVAYKERVVCKVKHAKKYYMLTWGLLDDNEKLFSLSESASSF